MCLSRLCPCCKAVSPIERRQSGRRVVRHGGCPGRNLPIGWSNSDLSSYWLIQILSVLQLADPILICPPIGWYSLGGACSGMAAAQVEILLLADPVLICPPIRWSNSYLSSYWLIQQGTHVVWNGCSPGRNPANGWSRSSLPLLANLKCSVLLAVTLGELNFISFSADTNSLPMGRNDFLYLISYWLIQNHNYSYWLSFQYFP